MQRIHSAKLGLRAKAFAVKFIMKFAILLLTAVVCLVQAEVKSSHDYCVIGAGPGGTQFSYFLQKAGRDYITFEKGPTPGMFYTKYPIHRTLISINKRNTGRVNKEFNLRHDWNSLIADYDDTELLMTKYSREFFPQADTFVQYLADYARHYKLNIQYNTTISNLKERDEDGMFHVNDQHNNEYTCKTVIVATGIAQPNKPDFAGSDLVIDYSDLTLDLDAFEAHSVLILGKANSAFETAQHIISGTNFIHFYSRHRIKLAWETHYVGDIRAVNNGPLDTYQLKSLDGALDGDVSELHLYRSEVDGRIYMLSEEDDTSAGPVGSGVEASDNDAVREGYDSVIGCLGFRFNHAITAPNATIKPAGGGKIGKYPRITYQYESTELKGVYFAGTNTHSLDFPKSAGGFIHGFRYTARTLHRILENRLEGNPWPSVKFDNLIDAIPHLLKRINEASDIYQMFSVLCEVMIIGEDGNSVTYLEAYPCVMASRLEKVSGHAVPGGVILTSLEYGKNFSGPGKDPFRNGRATGAPNDGHNSNFLHPILYYYKSMPTDKDVLSRPKKWILPIPDRIHHIVEDFTTKFDAMTMTVTPLRRFFETISGKDLRQFYAEQCLAAALTQAVLPESCRVFDNIKGSGVTCSRDCLRTHGKLPMQPQVLRRMPYGVIQDMSSSTV